MEVKEPKAEKKLSEVQLLFPAALVSRQEEESKRKTTTFGKFEYHLEQPQQKPIGFNRVSKKKAIFLVQDGTKRKKKIVRVQLLFPAALLSRQEESKRKTTTSGKFEYHLEQFSNS
ncbi:hypothetical protein CEXT_321481 [Caerostris extrusa]|uniref:Uncharacterized protein n=1 Tax=Caerostris extrusa TaxID=172846 RepID=A0AAV4NVB9_CAEEX|nr:hypothetical protein CEXT_321481 [Caerostris extrusa]